MKYTIEFQIRTKIHNTEMVESAGMDVEAANYKDATERMFAALKTCNTFQEFMDKLTMNEEKYPK
jgi:hypothetical protein